MNIQPIILTWNVPQHMVSRIPNPQFRLPWPIRTSLFYFDGKKHYRQASHVLIGEIEMGITSMKINKHRAADFGNFVPKTKWRKYVMNPAFLLVNYLGKSLFFHFKFFVKQYIFIKIFVQNDQKYTNNTIICFREIFLKHK